VIEPLLDLPSHLRQRLVHALDAEHLKPPYAEAAIRRVLGADVDAAALAAVLVELERQGVSAQGIVFATDLADRVLSSIPRPQLVWSGPEVTGLHARDTRRVYEELVASAHRSLWICAYTYYDGPKAFQSLALRMDHTPALQATLLLNIQRTRNDHTPSDELVRRFAERLWKKDWPGTRQPDVFYDPRSLDLEGSEGVLHAKAIVAASLSKHFRVLIERGLLMPLPGV
jgi:hypothetical protein